VKANLYLWLSLQFYSWQDELVARMEKGRRDGEERKIVEERERERESEG
jgi:hypothetical protein